MLGTPTSIFVNLENYNLQMYLCVHRGYVKIRQKWGGPFGSPYKKDFNVQGPHMYGSYHMCAYKRFTKSLSFKGI